MKKFVKKLLLAGVLLGLCGGTALFANGLENKNAIGVFVLGSEQAVGGIQYERRFTDLISGKFGVMAFYNNDTYNSNPFNMNLTVETDFTLFENTWKDKISSRLFAYGMVGYLGFIDRSYNYNFEETRSEKQSEKMHNNAVASVGFGFDFVFFDHLSVPLQFGFMGTFPDDPQVGFCGGVAVRYSW